MAKNLQEQEAALRGLADRARFLACLSPRPCDRRQLMEWAAEFSAAAKSMACRPNLHAIGLLAPSPRSQNAAGHKGNDQSVKNRNHVTDVDGAPKEWETAES